MTDVYDKSDIEHEADLSSPLHHGIIRYVPSEDTPVCIRNQLPSKNDRPFVYVPVGYLRREKEGYLGEILDALNLKIPNLVVVTPNSEGSLEEQYDTSLGVQDASSHPVAKNWSKEEQKDVLKAKINQLLESVLESSMEVGAWLMPECPRRKNGAAQMICDLLPKHTITNENNNEESKHVAFGLFGLNEEDQDVEFKKALQDTMVPLGSPVKNAVRLKFDLKLRDSAPLPQLTHLLIFESPEEKIIFRQALLDLVPDFTVAFGNITREEMSNVFETAKSASPIIIIQHSGPNIAKLTKMFQHVKKNIDLPQNTSGIPPIQGETDELIKRFINTWPTGFTKESVILADPLVMKGQTLQKRLLVAISSCFSLKSGRGDSVLIRRKALCYAWSFYEIAATQSNKKKFAAGLLQFNFNLFTFLSIVASVLYNQLYGDASGPKPNTQLIIYMSTILLPLCITALKQVLEKGVALQNWAAFQIASAQIYSEIYKFRTQSGVYRVQDKSDLAMQKTVETFAAKIQTIWAAVKPFLKEDKIILPKDFWNEDEIVMDSLLTVMTPNDDSKSQATYQTEGTGLDLKTSSTTTTSHQDNTIDPEDPPIVKFVDDNYKLMQTEDYMNCRMQLEMQNKSLQVGKMTSRRDYMSLVISIITIFTGGCAALKLQWTVPIILGITAALGNAQEFLKYPDRIEKGNDMIVQLNETKLRWMGLSMYEKELPQNKDNLVLTSERIILNEIKYSFGIGGSNKNE